MEVSALLVAGTVTVAVTTVLVVRPVAAVAGSSTTALSAWSNALGNRLVLVIDRRIQRDRRRCADSSSSAAAARLLEDAVERQARLQRNL